MWDNATVMKCRGVYQRMEMLYRVGMLPQIGVSSGELQKSSVGDLLDRCEKIAEDDSFWEQVPDIVISLGEETPKADLRRWLRDDIASCR